MTSSSDGNKSLAKKKRKDTLPETHMDTQNDGLEQVAPFKSGHFLVSMIIYVKFMGGIINDNSTDSPHESSTSSAVICNKKGSLGATRLRHATPTHLPSHALMIFGPRNRA